MSRRTQSYIFQLQESYSINRRDNERRRLIIHLNYRTTTTTTEEITQEDKLSSFQLQNHSYNYRRDNEDLYLSLPLTVWLCLTWIEGFDEEDRERKPNKPRRSDEKAEKRKENGEKSYEGKTSKPSTFKMVWLRSGEEDQERREKKTGRPPELRLVNREVNKNRKSKKTSAFELWRIEKVTGTQDQCSGQDDLKAVRKLRLRHKKMPCFRTLIWEERRKLKT